MKEGLAQREWFLLGIVILLAGIIAFDGFIIERQKEDLIQSRQECARWKESSNKWESYQMLHQKYDPVLDDLEHRWKLWLEEDRKKQELEKETGIRTNGKPGEIIFSKDLSVEDLTQPPSKSPEHPLQGQ